MKPRSDPPSAEASQDSVRLLGALVCRSVNAILSYVVH